MPFIFAHVDAQKYDVFYMIKTSFSLKGFKVVNTDTL